MNERYYTLEIICRQTRITPAAVRRYTRLGLIGPSVRHGSSALYSERDVIRLRKIVRLTRDLGLNLAGIEVVLRLTDEMDALRRELASYMKED